jgi:hypothetical protein
MIQNFRKEKEADPTQVMTWMVVKSGISKINIELKIKKTFKYYQPQTTPPPTHTPL